jgi:hypothetical protein
MMPASIFFSPTTIPRKHEKPASDEAGFLNRID